jgi:dipeptidyl aminopeptidase/acylaminoacyl peptidase
MERTDAVTRELRGTPEFAAVAEHLRRVHEPAFGRPHLVDQPHVAADGRVVVTGWVLDELAGRPRSTLYGVTDHRFVPLTSDDDAAKWGRFSPDGESLAFLSDRGHEGAFQLFLRDRSGKATQAAEVPGTVEYAHWSPDGRRILLGTAGLGAALAGVQGAVLNSGTADELPAWHPAVEEGVADSAWRALWLYCVDSGETHRLSPAGLNCWEANWCGSDQVLAVTSSGPGEGDWYRAGLTLIDIATNQARDLPHGDDQLGLPCGSPDGRYATIVQAVCSDRTLVAGDITVIDLSSGDQTVVDTHRTDVTCVQWIDENRLGYLGQRHLHSVAGIVDVPTGTAKELVATELSWGQLYPEGAFTPDGRLVVVQSAYRRPPEVALLTGHDGEVLASTAHPGTDYLLSIAGSAEPVSWTAPDGLEIEGILCTPAGDPPFPLVVSIHGGPISAFRDTWLMRYPWIPLLVSRGYAVLNPNPRGSGGRGQDFARQVVGDRGGAETFDHLSGIDALVERGLVDASRIGLIGGSHGGFMASWLVTQDQRFAASVPIAPVTDLYSQIFTTDISAWARASIGNPDPEQPNTLIHQRSPVLNASKVRTPCLNVAGALDRCTPPGQAREFHNALLSHGVESALVIYPQEGHGVRAYPAITDLLTRITSWFEKHMPPT